MESSNTFKTCQIGNSRKDHEGSGKWSSRFCPWNNIYHAQLGNLILISLVISSEGPATWDSILQPACKAEWRLIGLCNHPGFSMLVNPDLASQVVGGDFEERNLPVESLVNVVGIGPTWIPGVQHIVIQNSWNRILTNWQMKKSGENFVVCTSAQ